MAKLINGRHWDLYKIFLVLIMVGAIFVLCDHKTFIVILLALGVEKELDEIRKDKESH